MEDKKISVMIVDDSSVYRNLLRHVLQEDPEIEVITQAVNGRLALPRIRYYKPEILILDNEMPEMTGLETLEVLRKDHPEVGVIMFSAHTVEGAKVTIKALELGALDFVTKPTEKSGDASVYIRDKLITMIKSIVKKRRGIVKRPHLAERVVVRKPADVLEIEGTFQAAAIGISTGGPAALRSLLPMIGGNLRGPIFIVQHMPPLFTKQLAASLNGISSLTVVEAEDRMEVEKGHVYVAPGGFQMELHFFSGKTIVHITDDPPENNCKPSVNVLFRSFAEVYGKRGVGILMTGMGNDGLDGMRLMKQKGCYLICQDEASSLVYGMPAHPAREGLIRESLNIDGIAERIQKLIG